MMELDFIYQPLVDGEGAVCGIFVHGVDLTAHRKTQGEIENLNLRLRRSVRETHHRIEVILGKYPRTLEPSVKVAEESGKLFQSVKLWADFG